MKSMETILGISKEEYELLVNNVLVSWATIYARDNQMLQKLLTDQRIVNWFNIEYLKQLKEFKRAIEPYSNIEPKHKRKLYVDMICNIYERYPKPLLKAYKVKTKINQPSYNLN